MYAAVVVPQMNTDLEAMTRVVAEAVCGTDKPIFAVYMASCDIEGPLRFLDEAGILHYHFPEDATRARGTLHLLTADVSRPLRPGRGEGSRVLPGDRLPGGLRIVSPDIVH